MSSTAFGKSLLKISLLILMMVQANTSLAQIYPQNGAALHYRLVGFTVPYYKGATEYELNVYDAENKDLTSLVRVLKPDNKIIATMPAFDKKYMWQVNYLKEGAMIGKSKMRYFSVAANPYSNDTVSRVVVIDSAGKYPDLMVFFDNTRTLYNMNGEALWYLPVIAGITDSTAGDVRDLKTTADGTITFMTTRNIYEIDYNGNILWKGDADTSAKNIYQYHHEFTKLKNGHYISIKDTRPNTGDVKIPCGTVIEYDRNRRIVWEWNSCMHVKGAEPTMHFNAFYLDQKDSVLYTSYRNTSTVVKAKYPEGHVLAQYSTGQFYYQHNCSVNKDGNLILFNNNFDINLPADKRNNSVPTVAIFKEPSTDNDTLQKIWEFTCDIDTLVPSMSSAGGKVCELDNGEYLVCTGMPGRNFIVSQDKKILWNVLVQKNESGWKPYPVYRISPVRQHELKNLIFK